MKTFEVSNEITMLDAATATLAITGVFCGNLIGLPPDSQFAQLVLIIFGLNTLILLIRDRRAAGRQEKVRTIQPTLRRLAAAGASMEFVVAMTIYASLIPGHGWIATGLLLVGTGSSAQFLVQDRKLER